MEVRSWKSEVGSWTLQLQTSNFELPKFEVGRLKLQVGPSNFRFSNFERWKFEVGSLKVGPSNFRLPTSNFGTGHTSPHATPLGCYIMAPLDVTKKLVAGTKFNKGVTTWDKKGFRAVGIWCLGAWVGCCRDWLATESYLF